MDGAFDVNGQEPHFDPHQLQAIKEALDATLNPRVPNDIRQQALHFLEQVKTQPYAPQHGFSLADDWKQSEPVRYYGLQLLEYAVKYKWTDYTERQTEQLRTGVKQLAVSIREADALFLRNKIAQLWAEVAKRSWGQEWMDMDKLLVRLWDVPMHEKGIANKLLVLSILEILSDDICNREDAAAGLHLDVLGPALNEIMIPEILYKEHLATRGTSQEVRSGEEGWLARICVLFNSCVKEVVATSNTGIAQLMTICALKALNALRPTMAWISLKAVLEIDCCQYLFLSLHTRDVALQIAAVEVLFALLSRPYSAHFQATWSELITSMLRKEKVALLKQAFLQSTSAPGEDEEKHVLQKKISELLSVLADAIAAHPDLAVSMNELSEFLELLVTVLQNSSLVVSIPVLHSWTKLLDVEKGAATVVIFRFLGPLLQVSSSRLLRYEATPEDYDNEITQFLDEDFDTMPERHAFLGNYRRYCVALVELIARARPLEALEHVLSQTRSMLESGQHTTARGFNSSTWTRNAISVLEFDAQFNVVLSALKGFALWCSDIEGIPPDDKRHADAQQDKTVAINALHQWSSSITDIHVDDPEVAAEVLQIFVAVVKTTKPSADFVLRVVQHLLTMRLYDNPAHTNFSEAIKAFEGLRVIELQKLAISFSNELVEVYQELEPRITVLAEKYGNDQRLFWGYRAFLFIVIHRASGLNDEVRLGRLQHMLTPLYEAWRDPLLTEALSSYKAFIEFLGLGHLQDFWTAYRFQQVQDWSAQQLDEAGQARQAAIQQRSNDLLPLRMTKSMLAATTEKLKSSSDEFDSACTLWSGLVPVILPFLLQMLRHAQAFHNPANWSELPDEMQAVIKHTLQDRFWQSGISNESKEEFYARISGTKHSYEGFASTVRGAMRSVREQAYHLLYLLTRFEEQFFAIPNLATALAEALFDDAEHLSANHLHPIINLATGLVQRCPPHYRSAFLPPLLVRLFAKMDHKITREWEVIASAMQQAAENDELSDEMRTESILRQLTFSMVSFVPFLLEHERVNQQAHGQPSPKPTISDLVLSDLSILEPMILFCTHTLRLRDTRSCVVICKVFRAIIPRFESDNDPAPQVREFISTEVLKACITSLNEPYFADLQRDLATLIAQIILLYAPKTPTPRNVLLSLPNMAESKVDKCVGRICKQANEKRSHSHVEKQHRALVLDLLEGVRGVSIYEQGKIEKAKPAARKERSAMQQQYMEVEQRPTIVNGDETGLDGVAGLFDDA